MGGDVRESVLGLENFFPPIILTLYFVSIYYVTLVTVSKRTEGSFGFRNFIYFYFFIYLFIFIYFLFFIYLFIY